MQPSHFVYSRLSDKLNGEREEEEEEEEEEEIS